MNIIEFWSGDITLPSYVIESIKIGKNYVTQYAFNESIVSGTITSSDYNGHDLLRTNLNRPFDKILIRRKGAKRLNSYPMLCLEVKGDNYNYETLEVNVKFSWESFDSIINISFRTPNLIRESWNEKFLFKQEQDNRSGLRPPQIGALHAISAYFSVGENHDPGTVVLPTGTGKTETMLASLIYNRPKCLLVLVPSNALRNQLFNKFISLGILPIIGAVPIDICRPRVALIKSGIGSVEDASSLINNSNVIISTPYALNSSNNDALAKLCENCTDLYIDEAHHSSASTWNFIRSKFLNKHVVQFTATPFRNDGKHIGGKIIFYYKLGDAQRANYFKKIRLKTLEEYGTEEERNKAIAMSAINILKKDINEEELDHLLMARTNSKEKAENLLNLYNQLCPEYNPIVVYSKKGRALNDEYLSRLINRESRIVICVDMLGEGFDLPQLKVVAIHDGHQSFAITLQFIGRFTRNSEGIGDAAAVINLAEPKTEKNLQKLYSIGANWDELLSVMSEERIEKEQALQDIIESLKEKGNLHDQISLWNLHPQLTTLVYKTTCEEWSPERYSENLPKKLTHWHSISNERNLLVVLGLQESPVKWGTHENIQDINYKLLIAYWNRENNCLFIYSNDYSGMYSDKIVSSITLNSGELFCGPKVFNVLNNVELPLVKNLGASRIGAISFTSYFGPNVTDGLDSIEKNQSELNNIACVGYENGDRVIWGGTQKRGKIWSVKSGTIYDWIEWCEKVWNKLSDNDSEEPNIIRDFLKPVKIKTYYSGIAISAQWGEHIQSQNTDKVNILFGENEYPLYLVDVTINEIGSTPPIKIKLSTENEESIYKLVIDESLDGGYQYEHISGKRIKISRGKNEPEDLEGYARIDPFIIYYTDGTYSYNAYHIPTKLDVGEFEKEDIETWNWDNIPLNHESMGKEQNSNTIQFKTFKQIENDYDFIFNDDGKGEAADLVALKDMDNNTIKMCLIHCKNAIDGEPTGNIDNLYTVCGQAQKSIRVKHAGIKQLSKDLLRRDKLWQRSSATRFLKGDKKNLAYYVDKSRKAIIDFEVIIVQPGLKKDLASSSILKLLATTRLYLKKTTNATFRVIASG